MAEGSSGRRLDAWLIAGLIAGVILATGAIVAITRLDLPPRNLLDLVFASDPAGARDVLASRTWRALSGDIHQALAIDYVLILGYTLAIACGCLWGTRRQRSGADRAKARALGVAFAIGAVAAGILDLFENLSVERMLDGHFRLWPMLSTAAAWPKFFLIGASGAFAIATCFVRARNAIGGARIRGGASVGDRRATMLAQPPPGSVGDLPMFSEAGAAPSWRAREWTPAPGRIGIACSGGGIRSAAFNLGALQALRHEGIFSRASYLSAVSGGAYTAAALSMIERNTALDCRSTFYPPTGTAAFDPRTPEERHLRSNTSYIAPDGTGKLGLALRVLLGVAVNVLFGSLVLFVITRPLGWMLRLPTIQRFLASGRVGRMHVDAATWVAIWWPAMLGIAVGIVAVMRRFRHFVRYRYVLLAAAACLGLSLAMFVALIFLPWVGISIPKWTRWLFQIRSESTVIPNYVWLLNLLGIGAATGALVRILSRNSAKIATVVAAVLFPLTIVVAAGLYVVAAARSGIHGPVRIAGVNLGPQWAWALGASIVLLVLYAVSDQTTWSMHPFYKRRLCSAFVVRRTRKDAVEPVDYDSLQQLSTYDRSSSCPDPVHVCDLARPHRCEQAGCRHECRPAPELVVCAAANLSEVGATPTGRRALSFTFSAKEVGGRDIGWIKTQDLESALGEARKEDVTLPAAVAISGAAFSPAMGKMSRPWLRAILAITNARLGVWLPSPRYVTQLRNVNETLPTPGSYRFADRPRVSYLFKEIMGWHRKGDRFLYVTDGGHVENLGLVELLRRGCTDIYCFDASGDAVDTFFTLGEAVALARTELGVEIDIDPTPIRPEPLPESEEPPHRGQPWSPIEWVRAGYTFPPNDAGHVEHGTLVYAKAAVTEPDPWDVRAYGEKVASFPTLGTAHQLYLEEGFEAYRALGHAAAMRAAGAEEGEP